MRALRVNARQHKARSQTAEETHDDSARSRARPDHTAAALRDPQTMTPQGARLVAGAGGCARRRSAAAGRQRRRHFIEGTGGRDPGPPLSQRRRRGSRRFYSFTAAAGSQATSTHDRQARLLAIETGAVVVSVDYRRPPEAKFPAAFDDCFAATRDVIARIGEFGGDAARVGVAGDSAAAISPRRSLACRDSGLKLAAQLLVYPATDLVGGYADAQENARYASRQENAEGYFLSRAVMEWFAGHYLSQANEADWRASPLRAPLACRRRAGRGLHRIL